MKVTTDTTELDALAAKLAKLRLVTAKKVVRQSMRKATKPVLAAMKTHARSLARKGRKSTRKKGAKSMMRVVAAKLKLRAMKRSRKRIGFRILIAIRPAELQALLGRNLSAIPWYGPSHFRMGHKKRGGGGRVEGVRFMADVSERMKRRWHRDFTRISFEAIAKEMRKP